MMWEYFLFSVQLNFFILGIVVPLYELYYGKDRGLAYFQAICLLSIWAVVTFLLPHLCWCP